MRVRERGVTLVEVLIVMGITVLLLLVCGLGFSHNPFARQGALSSFASALDRAHGLAQTSGNGATLIKFVNSDAGITIPGYFFLVCAGRPIAGTAFGPCSRLSAQVGDIAVLSPAVSGDWALYVDSRGSIALGPWPSSFASTDAGTPEDIGSEPTCPAGTTVTLQFTETVGAVTHTVDCSTGVFQ